MDKMSMRDWVASLEEVIDNKLTKWLKHNTIQNGEAVQLGWQFEQFHFQLDIFWQDGQEGAKLLYSGPRVCHCYHWSGLRDKTFNSIMDRIGNLAMGAMHPPIDPTD